MFPLQHCADGVELHQLHQSQSSNLLKVQVTGAVILSQMQKKCVSLVSHLFYQLAVVYFHAASMMMDICTVSCRSSQVKGILCQELVGLALHDER